jgi:hypothetical protein
VVKLDGCQGNAHVQPPYIPLNFNISIVIWYYLFTQLGSINPMFENSVQIL